MFVVFDRPYLVCIYEVIGWDKCFHCIRVNEVLDRYIVLTMASDNNFLLVLYENIVILPTNVIFRILVLFSYNFSVHSRYRTFVAL